MKLLKEIIIYLMIIVVVVLFRTFILTPAKVSGDSMDDTLVNNEIVIMNKIYLRTSKIKRFDIVVIDYKSEKLIKRVIGLPNEKIEYRNNILYINDKENKKMTFEETDDFVYEVPDDNYFVMGDNRDLSKDSRFFGSIKKENILGKVDFALFPIKRFGKVK